MLSIYKSSLSTHQISAISRGNLARSNIIKLDRVSIRQVIQLSTKNEPYKQISTLRPRSIEHSIFYAAPYMQRFKNYERKQISFFKTNRKEEEEMSYLTLARGKLLYYFIMQRRFISLKDTELESMGIIRSPCIRDHIGNLDLNDIVCSCIFFVIHALRLYWRHQWFGYWTVITVLYPNHWCLQYNLKAWNGSQLTRKWKPLKDPQKALTIVS
jgi:hypothetical protein